MFELLLEKVLLNIVGPYIQGIDRQNLQLGIWSGNVSVHNVSIKPEILKMLELPFKMKFSSVGRLNATIPWSNLGSKPVEIVLEDVMIVLVPIDPEEWEPIEYKTVTQKLKRIENFAKQYSIKLAQKQNQQKVMHDNDPENQGMAGRITARAIDNVQVTIRNIHVRFENPLSKRHYAWGITLDEVLLYTTNEKWEREFIDRTIPQNLLLPIRKKLSLKNLGIYWTSDASDLYGDQPAETIREGMKRQILKDNKATNKKEAYIINISAECRLTQKNKRDPEKRNDPEYDVSLQLAPIDLLVRKTQVEDIIHLLGFLSEFQKFQFNAMVKKQKEVVQFLGDTERDIDREEFKMLLKKIRLNNEHDGLRSLEKVRLALGGPEQSQLFEELLMKLPDEDIGIAIKGALKEAEKEKRIRVYNQSKEEKANVGLISRWFSRKKKDKGPKDEEKREHDDSIWDGDDMEKLERYLEEAFPAENEIVLDEIRNIVRFDFLLDGGTVFLSNDAPGGKEEGVTLDYKGLRANINMTSMRKHIVVSLKDFGLNLRSRYSARQNYIDTNIIRRVNYWLPTEEKEDILTVSFDENPPDKKNGIYLGVKAQQVEIIYRKAAIQRLKNYFSVSTDNEALKSQAMDQLEIFQGGGNKDSDNSKSQAQAPSKHQYITIDLEAPILVIPLLQNGDLRSQCWVLNLGHLMIESREQKEMEQISYQMFEIALNKIKLEYYPSHSLYMKVQKSVIEKKDLSLLSAEEQEEFIQVFQLINQFSIHVNLDMALPEVETQLESQGLPKLIVDLTIPSVHLLLRPHVYKCLLKISDLFNFSEEGEMEIVECERTRLMAGCDRLGVLNVQEKRFGNLVWAKYFCILKGSYLHFFKSSSDPRPTSSCYIRNAKLSSYYDQDKSYAFSIENRYNKAIFAAENLNQMEQWMEAIKRKIEEYSTTVPNMFDKVPTLKSSPEKSQIQYSNYEAIKSQFSFQIKELKLTIFHTDQMDKLIELETKNFRMQMQSQLGKNTVYVKLESLEAQDYLFQYTNPDLKRLLTSIPPARPGDCIENPDLIEVNVVIMDQDHPSFKNKMTNNQIIAQFGYLYANFKPKVIRDTLDFFLPPPVDEHVDDGISEIVIEKPRLEKDDSLNRSSQDISFAENLNVTTLDLQINFKEICLRLVHMKTHICLNELAVRETNLRIVSKPHFVEFVGNLGNVQLYDTTNYPNTIDSNVEYEKINKAELLGVGEPDKNLLEIIYRDYDPRHPEANNDTRVYSFVVVNVSTVRINYVQKPILRFIDYIVQQIVPNVVPHSHHEEQHQVMTLTKNQIESAEKKIKNPKFLDLKVYALSPIIAVKPEPNSFEYWELKLGDLTVQNEVVTNTTSFKNAKKPLPFVYFDRYNILLKNMGIFRIEGQDSTRLSREVNFDLFFEKVMFSHEYHLIYDDPAPVVIKQDSGNILYQEVCDIHEDDGRAETRRNDESKFFLDETMLLKGKMTPLIAIWNHEDFVLLMKIINYNIAYHDGMDHLFVLDDHHLEEKSSENDIMSQEEKHETPLVINLTFENFTLLALDESELPFCMINLHLLQVNICKDDKGAVLGAIQAYQLNGSYFEKQQDKLSERKMLGQLDRINEHPLSERRKEDVIDEIVSSLIKYTELVANTFSSMSDKQKYVQVNVSLNIQPSGKKLIKVDVNGLKGFLVIDIYLALVKFLELDHSVHPPPKSHHQLQIEPVAQKESKLNKEDSLEVLVVAKNVLITAPASKGKVHISPYVLALRGDILFELKIVPKPSLEKSLTDIRGKTFYRATEQCTPYNESMHMKASLSHFEVFICEFEEILESRNFNEVRKRTMILPFTLSYLRKEHYVPNKSQTDVMPVVKNEINIELMVLRMSYQDALLLNNTIRYQLEHFNQSKSLHNSKTMIDEKSDEFSSSLLEKPSIMEEPHSASRLDETKDEKHHHHKKTIEVIDVQAQIENKDNWEPHLQEFNIGGQGVQIILINDAEGSLVPVIELTLQQVLGTMLLSGKKMRLSTKSFLNCAFFNPLPSRWEPIIEKFGFEFELLSNENPKQTLVFSMDENFEILNINLSEQMLETFYSTIITWKTDYENKAIKQDKSMLSRVALSGWSNKQETGVDVEDELIDYVSPYTIVNQTGYPIQIETDRVTGNTRGRQRSNSFYSKKLQDLHNKVYKIQDGGKVQYLVESNIEDLFKQSMQDVLVGINYISVKIMHPTLHINTVMGIDIDKALLRDYELEATTQEGNFVSGKFFRLVSLVKIDRNKKIITLSSPFRIENKTQVGYNVMIKSPLGEVQRFLKPKGESTIPVGFFEGQIQVRESESLGSTLSDDKIEISELADQDVKLFKLRTGSNFLLAESVKKDPTCDYFDISLVPTFLLKNACALEVFYRILCEEEGADFDSSIRKLEPQEVVHESRLNIKQTVWIQLRVQGVFWSQKVILYSPNRKSEVETEILLYDNTGHPLSIFIFSPSRESGTQKFYFYTKACIINETPYLLKYYVPNDHDHPEQLPGQDPTDPNESFNPRINLINETERLVLGLKGHHSEQSKIINISTLGSTYAELMQEDEGSMFELGLDMSVLQCDKEYKLLTKIITISPRYIFINKTPFNLEIKREGSLKIPVTLEKGVRETFQWIDWDQLFEKRISLRIKDDRLNDFWEWTHGFDVTTIGIYNFMAKSFNKLEIKYLKVIITLQKSSIFIVIDQEGQDQYSLKIKNECPGLNLRAYQESGSPLEGLIVQSGKTIPWSWEFPSQRKTLCIDFGFENSENFIPSEQTFRFDTLNKVQKVQAPGIIKNQTAKVYSVVTMEGNTRVLSFFLPQKGKSWKSHGALKALERHHRHGHERIYDMNLEVHVRGLGISLISAINNKITKKKERKEVLYLVIKGLEFKWLDSAENSVFQLRMKYLNVDNNIIHDTSFPVFLTPSRPAALGPDTRNYFLDILISQKKLSEIRHIETFQVLLDEITARIDGLFLDAVLEMILNFVEIFKDKDSDKNHQTVAESLFSSPEEANEIINDMENFFSKLSWKYRPIPEMTNNVFIQNLIINPIFINLSFQRNRRDVAENVLFLIHLFATVLGTALVNLDNAPLRLRGLRLDNVFDSQDAIVKKILDRFKDESAKSIFKILGSLDIVGNPVGLFNNISTGVVDLLEKPLDGFLQGPLEGGKGLIKGTSSLVKNTVSGTFNSIGKVTGSLASGLSSLALDNEYLTQREKNRLQRPNHLGEGVYLGLNSLAKGVGYGLKGVVLDPIEGLQRGGLKGFLRGAVKGFSGLFTKPVIGALDAASKAAEGIKNTANMFDQKPNDNRIRFPRAFYGKEKFYRTYMETDAEIVWLLHLSKEAQLMKEISLVNAFDIFPDETQKDISFILALSYEYVLLWDVKRAHMVWAVNPKEIQKITLFKDGMVIQLSDMITNKSKGKLKIKNCDFSQNEYIGGKLAQLKRNSAHI